VQDHDIRGSGISRATTGMERDFFEKSMTYEVECMVA
jgi:hypothetical protein